MQGSPAAVPAAQPVAEAVDGDAAEQPSAAALDYDGWELDQQLRHVERVLGVKSSPDRRKTAGQEILRIDAAHGAQEGPHPARHNAKRKPGRSNSKATRRTAGQTAVALLAWTTLALGTMAFVCGGILLGWSMIGGRNELWNIGMPVILGGQVALLVGLILQLDRLWHDNRRAADKLDEVDQRLDDLNSAATMLGASHSSPASAFYSHLADGAGPELLLTDLKGQLDLLAIKLCEEKRCA